MTRARALFILALSGCQPLATPIVDTSERDAAIEALEARVSGLADSVAGVERAVTASTEESRSLSAEVTEHSKALGRVETTLAELPGLVKSACPPPPPRAQAECQSDAQRVPVSGDKMVVGVREHVWVDPPAAALVARIDTSLASNSLYVSDIVEFQRDGSNWVRFNLAVPDSDEPVQVERALRARGKSDGDTSGPLSIRLRLSLGDVTESYDFNLVDRRTRDYQLRLGRSFLRDMALVDVSRRFLQPRPSAPTPAT